MKVGYFEMPGREALSFRELVTATGSLGERIPIHIVKGEIYRPSGRYATRCGQIGDLIVLTDVDEALLPSYPGPFFCRVCLRGLERLGRS